MNRKPAVAGTFYPSDQIDLEEMIGSFLNKVPAKTSALITPSKLKGIISPHAGYIYSGPVAAHSYKLLLALPQKKYNVFLLGPAHLANAYASVENYDNYETPFGKTKINKQICEELLKNKQMDFIPDSQASEHSLEVQLPFLQKTLKEFELVPLVLGEIFPDYIAEILQPYYEKDDSLFIISSDLSHYEPYETAKKIDRNTIKVITSLDLEKENQIDACGRRGIQVAMRLAKNNSHKIQLLDYRNSGDTAGDKSGVVGYAALAITK